MKGSIVSRTFLTIFFFLMAICVPSGASLAADGNSIYFPHAMSDATWGSEFCVVNTSASENLTGAFTGYDESGAVVSSVNGVVLGPNGRKQLTLATDFANAASIRYVVFDGDRSTGVGYMKFFVDGKYRVATPGVPGSELNSGDIFVSHIASDEYWQTFVSLVNTNSQAVSLAIEFNNGATRQIDLAAGAHRYFSIAELFGGPRQSTITSAVIKNATGVIGVELFLCENLNILSGIVINDDTTDRLYFPHIAAQNGWATGIVAFNPSDAPAQLTVVSYDAAGAILDTSNVTVASKEKYVGTIAKLGLPLTTEWIDIQSTRQIAGFELFTITNRMGGYTGVDISRTSGVFPKLEKNGGATGIAFVNLDDQQATVSLKAYNDAGSVIATRSLGVAAKNKIVSVAPKLFAQDIGNATYIGFDSDREIVGFQLNQTADNMMLDGLPALGAKPRSELEQEVSENIDLINSLVGEQSWALDEVSAIMEGEGPEATITPPLESIDFENLPSTITMKIDYGSGYTISDGSVVSGSIVLNLTDLVFSETQINVNMSLTFNNFKRDGETVASGSIAGSLTLKPGSGNTLTLDAHIQFNNVQLQGETISGKISMTASGLSLDLEDVTETGFGNVTITFENLVMGEEQISSGTITLTPLSATQFRVSVDLSTGRGPADMILLVDMIDEYTTVLNTSGSSAIGDMTFSMNNVTMDTQVCEAFPVSGTMTFFKGGESGAVTFTDACDGSYLYTEGD